MIEEILNNIAVSLKEHFPDVFDSLNPGATEAELALIRDRCLGAKELPADLALLYKWHNGQAGYFSMNQNDNRTFLSIEEVIDAWEFLNDPMEDISGPVSRNWIPIAYNGAGDYLMYDLDDGKILCYWHDDKDRPVQNANLTDWLTEVLNASRP